MNFPFNILATDGGNIDTGFRVVFWEIRDYSLGTKIVCPVLSKFYSFLPGLYLKIYHGRLQCILSS